MVDRQLGVVEGGVGVDGGGLLRRSRCRVDHYGHGQAILGPALLEIVTLPIPLGVFLWENRSLSNHIPWIGLITFYGSC